MRRARAATLRLLAAGVLRVAALVDASETPELTIAIVGLSLDGYDLDEMVARLAALDVVNWAAVVTGRYDIIDEVAGVYPKIMLEGAMDAGAWSCGMVAGLIHDVPTVVELIDRIMAEAEALITERLAGFAAAPAVVST